MSMNAEQMAGHIFDFFDKDKSGTMDRQEVKAMLEETYRGLNYKVSPQDIEDTIRYMDADGDGTVTRAEYIALIKKTMSKYNY